MNKTKIAAFAVGPVAAAALNILALPIITWFFTADDIGRIAMLQVVVNLVVLTFSLGLDQAYVREYHEVGNKRQLFKSVILPGLLLLFAAVGGIFAFEPGLLSELLFKVDSPTFSLLVSICLVSAFVSRFLAMILRMQERGLAFSMSQVMPKALFLAVIGIIVGFRFGHSLLQLLVAHTVSFTAVVLVFTWNTRKDWHGMSQEKIDRRQFAALLRFGAPLIFGGLASWGMMMADRLFLRKFSTFTELGIFSVAASFAAAALIFQLIFSTVWAPTVYKWAASGINTDKIDKVSDGILAAVVFLFSITGLFSWVIPYFLPAKYGAVPFIVVSCMACPLFYTLSETTVVGIGVSRKTSLAMAASFAAVMVCLVGNYILVPRYGAAGAAVASAGGFWCFFLFRTELAILAWRPLPRLKLYVTTLICLAAAVSFTMFGAVHHGLFLCLWGGILACGAVCFRGVLVDVGREVVAIKVKFLASRRIPQN